MTNMIACQVNKSYMAASQRISTIHTTRRLFKAMPWKVNHEVIVLPHGTGCTEPGE